MYDKINSLRDLFRELSVWKDQRVGCEFVSSRGGNRSESDCQLIHRNSSVLENGVFQWNS